MFFMMNAIQISRFGGPEVLTAVDLPSSPLPADGLRIRVNASGINFAEVMMRQGLYPEAPRPPFVPGFEIAGVVTEAGPEAAAFSAGDRVLAMCRFGGYVSEAILPSWQVRRTPPALSDIEAAAVPVNFSTAWIALMEMARVRKSDRVLISGAAGGVGSAAVQIALREGAYVIGLAGTSDKLAALRSLGASEAHTYRDWESEGGSQRFDVILDARGGRHTQASLKALEPGGRLVSYGVSSIVKGRRRSVIHSALTLLRTPLITPLGLAMANRGVFGLNLLTLYDSHRGRELLTGALDRVLDVFARGGLRVLVDRAFPLGEAGAAHARLQSGSSIGKVVLVRDDRERPKLKAASGVFAAAAPRVS
jgi:NADPH:quinone reductase-like Zn-dependent oxidoreductase